jgi:hypothetical protein
MELLIIVLVVVLIVHVVAAESEEKNFSGNLKDCRFREEPHRWSYNKNDKLECLECGFVAGREEPQNEG